MKSKKRKQVLVIVVMLILSMAVTMRAEQHKRLNRIFDDIKDYYYISSPNGNVIQISHRRGDGVLL